MMHSRTYRILIIVAIVSLVITSATLAYMRRIDASTFNLTQQTNTTLYQTEKIRQFELEDSIAAAGAQLAQKEAEVKAKQEELEAKQAELAKAETERLAKVKELESAQKKIKDQQSQISSTASELKRLSDRPPLFSFKVESSTLASVEQKKNDVKEVVTAAYDLIGDIYGKPYLLKAVTISFVDSFSSPSAAAEIVITNGSEGLDVTIKLKDFDKNSFNDVNSIIHEVVHAYHGIAILEPVAYEEGITVAATDVVMAQLIAQGKIPSFKPLYIRLASSEYATASSLPSNAATLYGSPQVAHYYQVAGYGWYQLYKADSNFFKNFNDRLYSYKRDGNELTESLVKEVIKQAYSGPVQGKSIGSWLETAAFKLQ
ncbi:MAG TPA: hypothetical protein VGE59_05095 [Patescibacteria group bacterium]